VINLEEITPKGSEGKQLTPEELKRQLEEEKEEMAKPVSLSELANAVKGRMYSKQRQVV